MLQQTSVRHQFVDTFSKSSARAAAQGVGLPPMQQGSIRGVG